MRTKSVITLLAVILVTAVLGAALSATRTSVGLDDQRVQLTLGVGYSVDWMKPFAELCDEFSRRHPHIEARVVGIPGNYYEKVLVMMAGRTAPDLMWMGQGFGLFASRDAFLDVENAFDIDEDEYYMQVVNCYRFDGRLRGFPYGGDSRLIIYNVDMFEQAGLDPPPDDWTVEQFRETARRLTRRGEDGRIICWGLIGQVHFGAFGAYRMNADMTQHQIRDQAWIDFFNFALAMKYEDRSTPIQGLPPVRAGVTDRQLFEQGKAAMIGVASYDLVQLRETIDDFRWDLAPFPRAVEAKCAASTQGYAIWKQTPHPKEATELLKFLVSPAGQEKLAHLALPVHRATTRRFIESLPAQPSRRDVLLQSMDMLDPAPRHPRLNELERAREDITPKVYARDLTPAEAMRQLAEQYDKILSRAYVKGR